MLKKITALALGAVLALSVFVGCETKPASTSATDSSTSESATAGNVTAPKYVFMFIGDGMSSVQINAAQILMGNNTSGEVATKSLNFTQFPVAGLVTTYDSTSFCPDSASTATALSCGVKTHSGVVGLEANKTTVPTSITELLKDKGMKIGIVSSVTINHATPAAYYSHIASRNEYYDIALQMTTCDFDYFGGGTISKPTGADKDATDAYEILKKDGFTVATTKEEIAALNASTGKCYAVTPVSQDSGSMPYAIDTKEGDLSLSDFVEKGIEVLDNENGFFMMCESGKIDWACHANDAMSAIQDVIEFDNSIKVAINFAKQHPDETLIIVTGDHETGGMTIGYATTGYNTAFDILNNQKMSYVEFDKLVTAQKEGNANLAFADVMPFIKENFGLIAPEDADASKEENKAMVLTDYEYQKLKDGFAESMKAKEERSTDEASAILYGTYDPLSVSLTHVLNNKAGIGWTSYSHTGTPVPVFAYGVSAELFNGSYDNTDVFKKLCTICDIK